MRQRRSPVWVLPHDQFQNLVLNANSVQEVLNFFGLENGSYKTVRQRCQEENIPFDQFKANAGRKRLSRGRPLDEITTINSSYSRKSLKKRLLRENLLNNVCSICGLLPHWQDKPLTLVLDHINGINNDNRLCNLRLICPNCNSQTPTFAGRTKRKRKNCHDCGCFLEKSQNKRCFSCNM